MAQMRTEMETVLERDRVLLRDDIAKLGHEISVKLSSEVV